MIITNPSSVFVRGQVWYWEDPIYGAKELGVTVHTYEATFRYSRYVLIIEDENDTNSILAIPLTTAHHLNDIEICLWNDATVHSYVRLGAIFPVNKRSLKKYVCTIPEKSLIEISDAIINLIAKNNSILHKTTNVFQEKESTENIKELTANIVEKKYQDLIQLESEDIKFSETIELNDIKAEDDLELKPAVDEEVKYVSSNKQRESSLKRSSFWTDEKKKAFLELYQTSGVDAVMKEYFIGKNTIRNYVIRFNRDFGILPTHNIYKNWTSETVKEFFDYYQTNGAFETSKKYGTTTSTIYANFSRFSRRYPDLLAQSTAEIMEKINNKEKIVKEEKKQDNPEVVESLEKDLEIIASKIIANTPNKVVMPKLATLIIEEDSAMIYNMTNIGINDGIFKLTNIMVKGLKSDGVIDKLYNYRKNQSILLMNHSWYNILGSLIPDSFISFLNINRNTKSSNISRKVIENNKYYQTWKFLHLIHSNNTLSNKRNGTELMTAYQEKYGPDTGVDIEWLIDFHKIFDNNNYRTNAININKKGIDIIADMLKIYCIKK